MFAPEGNFSGRARSFSLYTWARLDRPAAPGVGALFAAATPVGILRVLRASSEA